MEYNRSRGNGWGILAWRDQIDFPILVVMVDPDGFLDGVFLVGVSMSMSSLLLLLLLLLSSVPRLVGVAFEEKLSFFRW